MQPGEISSAWSLRLAEVQHVVLAYEIERLMEENDSRLSDLNFVTDASHANVHDQAINAIRNTTLIKNADILIVKFGDQYRQWNAAFDAGMAKALDKPIITLHDNKLNHALKEINQAASASCRSVEQVVNILSYLIDGTLEKQSLNVAE